VSPIVGPPPEGGGGSQPISSATVTLTSEQLLDIMATPILVLASPGAGKAIIPILCVFNYTAGADPYVDGGGNLEVDWGNEGDVLLFAFASGGFWDQADSQVNVEVPAGGVQANNAVTLATDQAVYVTNETASPTGGDGTVTVTLYYAVQSLA
jgi:hypothetical protein